MLFVLFLIGDARICDIASQHAAKLYVGMAAIDVHTIPLWTLVEIESVACHRCFSARREAL